MVRKLMLVAASTAILAISPTTTFAQQGKGQQGQCATLPGWSALQNALVNSITAAVGANGGLGFNMWGTLVANDGTVCAVAFSGTNYTGQWLGSRVISAQKANTANDFSLGHNSTPGASLFPSGLALSTANLFSAVQPGGSLYGLQHSNPVDTEVAYANNGNGGSANAWAFGTANDPMVGQRIGGVNVFGGGLALYSGGAKVARSASAAIPPAPTTWSRGEFATSSGLINSKGSAECQAMRLTPTISFSTSRQIRMELAARARHPPGPEALAQAPAVSAIRSA
jgi:hypothetical protein